MTKDTLMAWWSQYDEDILKRDELLEPIVGKLDDLFVIDSEELRKKALTLALRAYFDDAMEYAYTLKAYEEDDDEDFVY